MHIRTLAGDSPAAYLAYEAPAIATVADRYERYVEGGNYRPEWMWVAERGGDVVARLSFWGRPGESKPSALDHFDIRPGTVTPVDAGAALLSAAYADVTTAHGAPADYHLFLPPHWRDHADADTVHTQIDAARRVGLTPLV